MSQSSTGTPDGKSQTFSITEIKLKTEELEIKQKTVKYYMNQYFPNFNKKMTFLMTP